MMQADRTRSAWLPWWNACSRGVRRAALPALLCALLFAPVLAAENEAGADDPAIPPGEEELIAAMLGRGIALPDGCVLASGHAEYTVIKATYVCPGGEVVLQLAHPDKATADATQTANFAIMLRRGVPSDDFANVLVSLIRSREGAFEWTWPAREKKGASEDYAQ